MKFLVDNAISPMISLELKKAGFDAVHVRDYGLQASTDEVIFHTAEQENRIIISADTDFAFLLAQRKSSSPSVILFRKGAERNPVKQIELLLANLNESVQKYLNEGCIIIFEES